MRRAWRILTSTRATVGVMLCLGMLLLLNVVLPQAGIQGPGAVEELASRSAAARFFLVTLGFDRLSTSPAFLGALGFFFLNLASVLVDRASNTVRRLRFSPPSPEQLEAWAREPKAVAFARPAAFDAALASAVLSRLGYRVSQPGGRSVWGVKNRTAVLGFPLFHLSFFVLCAAAVTLYYTRDVSLLTLVEEQTAELSSARAVRRAPLGDPPRARLTLARVEPLIEQGKALQLSADVRLDGAAPQTARINHPAVWGELTVLVERAGVAPVLWLRDRRGFTLDRVAVATANPGGAPTVAPLADGAVRAVVTPIPPGEHFPSRAGLSTVAIELSVLLDGKVAYRGRLKRGEVARFADFDLKLDDVRYWAALRLVRERGGGLIVAGFVLAVVGLMWRMLWYRREVGITWDEERIALAGFCEFFPLQFREELEALRGLIEKPEPARRA